MRNELERGYDPGYEFLDNVLAYFDDDITLLEVEDRNDEIASDIRVRLDAGEANSLLGAIEHCGTLATDDLAARKLAVDYDVPVTGSVGILVLGVQRDVINVPTANEWLTLWEERRGYYASVKRIEKVLEW